jgi:toxin-antitoxin system PIN domain toxin
MILPDVNVLVYAHREDAARHSEYRAWLQGVWRSPATFAVSDLVLSGCLRVLTHPRVFDPPTPFATALAFIEQIRSRPNAVIVQPGPQHWTIFKEICAAANVTGNLVPDAFLAALAIETGSDLITTDHDFARFPGLRWRHPLSAEH